MQLPASFEKVSRPPTDVVVSCKKIQSHHQAQMSGERGHQGLQSPNKVSAKKSVEGTTGRSDRATIESQHAVVSLASVLVLCSTLNLCGR